MTDPYRLERRWAIVTRWPDYGEVTFTVYQSGVISDVIPSDTPLTDSFSSIEGFDLLGADPFPYGQPAVPLIDALHGGIDPVGYMLVAYPKYGPGRYMHTTGEVLSIRDAPDHGARA